MPNITTATRTSPLTDLLQRVYLKEFQRHYNTRSVFLTAVKPEFVELAQGEHISIPADTSLGNGYIWSSSGDVPPASIGDVKRLTFNMNQLVSAIEFDPAFLEDTASKLASPAHPMHKIKDDVLREVRHGLNFDFVGGDGTGKLANMHATPAATGTTFKVDNIRGLRNNQLVDILLKSNGSVGSGGVKGVRISINRSSGVVTIKDGAQLADGTGDAINAGATLWGVYRHKSYGQAPFGLLNAIGYDNIGGGAANYGGIDRSDDAYDWYRCNRLHNSGTPRRPKWTIFQDMLDLIDIHSEGETNLIMVGHEVWGALMADELLLKQHTNGKKSLYGWAEAIDFRGIPLVRDKHIDPTRAWFLDTRQMRILHTHLGKWLTDDKGAMLQRIPGKTWFQAVFQRQLQLVVSQPIAFGVIEDLADVA